MLITYSMIKLYVSILIALLLQSCNALEQLSESSQNIGSCNCAYITYF